jgi:hypothetical protein
MPHEEGDMAIRGPDALRESRGIVLAITAQRLPRLCIACSRAGPMPGLGQGHGDGVGTFRCRLGAMRYYPVVGGSRNMLQLTPPSSVPSTSGLGPAMAPNQICVASMT